MGKAQAERTANQYAGQILYSGDQSMVNGAYYIGAIVFFLFILGLFLVRGPLLWGSIGALAVALLMAWGKNAAWFNEFLFQHLPLYNKFRVPSMSLVVAFVVLPLIGFKGLELLLQKEREDATKTLLRAVYIVGGLAAVLWVLGSSLLGVDGANDAMWTQQGLNLDMILDDRKALLRSSALRSLVFVVLAAAAIWLHITRKIKMEYLAVALGLLVLVDLWGFDKDQLGEDDLISERNLAKQQEPTATDLFILKDADPHYRVLNTTVSSDLGRLHLRLPQIGGWLPRCQAGALPGPHHRANVQRQHGRLQHAQCQVVHRRQWAGGDHGPGESECLWPCLVPERDQIGRRRERGHGGVDGL